MRNYVKRLFHPSSALVAVALAAVLTGCGDSSGDPGGGSEAEMSVSVTEPSADAEVTVPFTVKVDSSVDLGATDTGLHHVHIWFDDKEEDYLVVESETTEIKSLGSGAHTMHVSLRNADHSPAGAETEVPISVGGSGGDRAPTEDAPAPAPADPYEY